MCMYLIAIANVIMFLDPYPLFISNWIFTMKIVKTNNNKKYVKTIYWQTQDQTPPWGRRCCQECFPDDTQYTAKSADLVS